MIVPQSSPMPPATPVIYFDYQSTTPCDPRVVDKMMPYFTQHFGNPHSSSHVYGRNAKQAVEEARERIAHIIGADSREIFFTSGATEANNMAIKGLARFYGDKKRHIITVATEHKCVLDSCRHLELEGFKITYLPVHSNGLIDIDQLESFMTDNTLVVSIMAVNNEIGVIQPLNEIGRLCRARGIFFHTDAAQAIGKIAIDVEAMNIDLLSLTGHKIYAPKGVGALYIRRKPRVRLTPLFNGGGQERGLRSGTVSPPLAVALGEACYIAEQEMASESERLYSLRDHFYNKIKASLNEVYLNGDLEQRIPGNLNLSFAYVEGEGLMMRLKDLAVSSGSACTSSSLEPSYVLRALGVEEELAHTSLRIGFGRMTTFAEVDYAAHRIVEAVTQLREMSPLYEMVQEGIDIKSVQWAAH